MRNKGTFDFSNNFEGRIRGPLDAKMLVQYKTDLTGSTTWLSNSGDEWSYVGMIVSVMNDPDSGVYRLKSTDYTDINNWELLGSNVDLSNYYTSGQTDTLLLGKSDTGHTHSQYATESGLTSEISSRINNDNGNFGYHTTLSTAISTETQNRVNQDNGNFGYHTTLSTAISVETQQRIMGDVNVTTNTQTYTDSRIGIISPYPNVSSAISAERSERMLADTTGFNILLGQITGETSSRISADSILSARIDNISGGTYDDTNLWTALSGETSGRTDGDQTLWGMIFTETSDRVTSDGVLSTSISTETLERISADAVLSTRIDNIPSGSTFDPTNLWNSLSGETQNRINGDNSLSTIINGFGTIATYNFWSGTTAQYEAVNPKLSTTLYFITA